MEYYPRLVCSPCRINYRLSQQKKVATHLLHDILILYGFHLHFESHGESIVAGDLQNSQHVQVGLQKNRLGLRSLIVELTKLPHFLRGDVGIFDL